MNNYLDLGPESLQALSRHGESLITIQLHVSRLNSVLDLSLLRGCTNLVSLMLYESVVPSKAHLEEQQHTDIFLETVAWVMECKKLRSLDFAESSIPPALIAPILLDNSIHLTSLGYYEYYVIGNTKAFYKAVANQTSLKSLSLLGLDESAQEVDILVESLTHLVNLTNLELGEVTRFFVGEHLVRLASSLPRLEVWKMNGCMILSAIWSTAASLRSLQRLDLSAMKDVTADEILGFINDLGPGNKGLLLSVTMFDYRGHNLSWAEFDLIQDAIAEKVDGRFEYNL